MEADQTLIGPRIVVVGTTGSGKTTVARQLAEHLGVLHVELDALNWDPGWVDLNQTDREEFRKRVSKAVAGDAWVADGGYSSVRDLVWSKATAVVWLNYPLWLILWRLLKRTVRRVVTKEPLWQGNTESFRRQFLSTDSILLWALKTHGRRNRSFRQAFTQPEHAHVTMVRHRWPTETSDWLRRVAAGHDVGLGAAVRTD